MTTLWELLGPFVTVTLEGFGVITFFMLPGIIATCRNHNNATAIWVCGVLLWPVGLIWSLTDNVKTKVQP